MIEEKFRKIGNILYERLPDKITQNETVRQDLCTLAPAGNTKKLQKEFYAKKLSLCAMIVCAGLILSVLFCITDLNDANISDNLLIRNDYGDGDKSYSLTVSDGEGEYDISLELLEREYTESELISLADNAFGVIYDLMLGENDSFDMIEYDLNFETKIDGYPFSVKYDTDWDYIDSDGTLVMDKLSTPVLTEIAITLEYEKFSETNIVNAMVYTKAKQKDISQKIQEELDKKESENRESKELILPEKIGESALKWSFKKSHTGLMCLILTPVLMVVIYITNDRDLHQKVEQRREQMMIDYPEIVSSLALLIGAGMTVPNAWRKIACDYKRRRDEGGESRYAYEEMLFTVYEMESGIIQSSAYERFGRRCRIPCYNKLSTIVSQNIRKGAANLPKLLREEASDAFEERKHLARKQGEQAGTKLLAPMMLLLAVTLVVIMIPAVNVYF